MKMFLLLAIEATVDASEAAETASEGGFGLNFNILETNLINLVLIIGLLVYFGRGFLGKILSERQATIATAIQDAEKRRKEAVSALAAQQQKLAQAQAEAERIKSVAEESANAARDAVLAQAAQDIQRLRDAAAQDTTSEQERAIADLRRQVAVLALQRVESQLAARLTDSVQQQLVDRSIALIGD